MTAAVVLKLAGIAAATALCGELSLGRAMFFLASSRRPGLQWQEWTAARSFGGTR